jgi:hypothetical protein
MRTALWLLAALPALAQMPVNPALGGAAWPASWIVAPGAPPYDYGVYHFRRGLDLSARPERFPVHEIGRASCRERV